MDGEQIATLIRADIFRATRCPASAGIASNIVLAKIAVGRAKPNGQYRLQDADAAEMFGAMKVSELPGVGWAMAHDLKEMGIRTAGELAAQPQDQLQAAFGRKKGEALWKAAHGMDSAEVEVEQPRKTLGVEVNWGLRFLPTDPIEPFVEEMSAEVSRRLKEAKMRGRAITLKVMRRKPDAVATKYMGHGPCDVFNKSAALKYVAVSALRKLSN